MDRVRDIIYAIKTTRTNFPPKVRKFLHEHGYEPILEMHVYRAPIVKALQVVADILTFGKWSEMKRKLNYDDIYHLGLLFRTRTATFVILEKNHVIEINAYDASKEHELMQVPVLQRITINDLLLGARQFYNSDKEFYGYDGETNNCQRFVYSLLAGSGLIDEDLYKFIVQNAPAILKDSPLLKKLLNLGSNIASRADIILKGGKLDLII